MHHRYENQHIARIWGDENKLALWQETELAVIAAREILKEIPDGTHQKISEDLDLTKHPINLEFWKKRDAEIHHDLNAFLDERRRHIDGIRERYFHEGTTSYDTEEPAFVKMLAESTGCVRRAAADLAHTLQTMALKWRYTPMLGRTHGQEAQLQSFGKRCLCWFKQLQVASNALTQIGAKLMYSKISGAVGNYGGINPTIEEQALGILNLQPFYGATQIMPRIIYQPLANALCGLVSVINQIAIDIRLNARSGRPLCQEPFGKHQVGSSAMPHKKNTIATEQMAGMESMAKGYLFTITDRINTWEERAIEQSCVERVAWPDLFHVTMHALIVITRVLNGLRVYPRRLLTEINNSLGCYASNEAKQFLKENGFDSETAYRIIQLAAFNAFSEIQQPKPFVSFATAVLEYNCLADNNLMPRLPINESIAKGCLITSDELAATETEVAEWNQRLKALFAEDAVKERWDMLFGFEYCLRHESELFAKVFGE